MKNQISLFIVLLVCFATCTAHDSKDNNKKKAEAPEAGAEAPVGFSYLLREGPGSSFLFEEGKPATAKKNKAKKYDESYTSFSSAFAEIRTLRGNTEDKKREHHPVKEICSHTDYPKVCVSTLTPFLKHDFDLMKVLEAAIKACSYQTKYTISLISKHLKASPEVAAVLGDCKEQYSDAQENLQRAIDAIPSRDLGAITVMLSAVMADVSACESGFEDHKASPAGRAEGMVSITAGNCLAIASLIPYQ